MRYLLAFLFFIQAAAGDVVFYYSTGNSLYVRFSDGSNTAVNLTEGSLLNTGLYTVTDSAIGIAGLGAGTFSAGIFSGTAVAQSAGDTRVGSLGKFVFDGTNEVDEAADTLTNTTAILADTNEMQPKVDTANTRVNLALPAAAPNAAGGLPISDTGGLDLDTQLGYLTGDAFARLGAPTGASIAADIASIEVGTTTPRINYPAGPAYRLKVSDLKDGTYGTTRPVRLAPGATDIAFAVDMRPLFGNVLVTSVGAPSMSGGSITAAALGPRDHEAMIQLAGTATANETPTVTTTVTMANGDTVTIKVSIIVTAA